MLTIDGSQGEGGGQIIRTSLALSLITGTPFRVFNVRARREKPGLQRQHLTGVRAAAEIGRAEVEGAAVNSSSFTFRPGKVVPGEYRFSVGTAGSMTLVLQTVLPPLMVADAPSRLSFEGGTHNPHAPPFEFIERAFLPLVRRAGPRVSIELERYGFYPPGGGRFNATVEPAPRLAGFDLTERGPLRAQSARALVVNLPRGIAERELGVVKDHFGWADDRLHVSESRDALSPGNALMIEVESEHVTELFTRVGERGLRAERVAEEAIAEARDYLNSGAAIGEHLADQLLIPLALAGGGSFTTNTLSLHTTTNIEIIRKFLPVEISAREMAGGAHLIEIRS